MSSYHALCDVLDCRLKREDTDSKKHQIKGKYFWQDVFERSEKPVLSSNHS